MSTIVRVARVAGAASLAAAIALASRAGAATGPMTEGNSDPDLSATLFFLGGLAATVAVPLLAFRLSRGGRRVALGTGLAAGAGFFVWNAGQPINAGSQWLLLIVAGLAIGDAALLVWAPRVASLLAVAGALAVILLTPLPAHLIARAFISVGSPDPASFSTWILFAGVYTQIVLGIAILVSSPMPARSGQVEARAHLA